MTREELEKKVEELEKKVRELEEKNKNSDQAVKNATKLKDLSQARLEILSKTSKTLNDIGTHREAELELEKIAMAERVKGENKVSKATKRWPEQIRRKAEKNS